MILALIPYSPNLRFTKSHTGMSSATVLIPTKEPNHVVTSIIGDEAASPIGGGRGCLYIHYDSLIVTFCNININWSLRSRKAIPTLSYLPDVSCLDELLTYADRDSTVDASREL